MTDDAKFGIAVFLVVGAFFIYLVWSSVEINRKANQCETSCGVRKAKLIDEACHCMSDNGWERK